MSAGLQELKGALTLYPRGRNISAEKRGTLSATPPDTAKRLAAAVVNY